jgi:hypothetical protein
MGRTATFAYIIAARCQIPRPNRHRCPEYTIDIVAMGTLRLKAICGLILLDLCYSYSNPNPMAQL